MLLFLYAILEKVKNRNIKVKVYNYLGILANIYIRINYYVKYVVINKKKWKLDSTSNIVVSLTSFPARINLVHLTICSLMNQTVKPAKLILWLADTQFPSLESLPLDLLRLIDCGLEIRFCDDLRSHKKYYYTCKEYPSSVIITVDDDLIYPCNTLKKLVEKHQRYPECVCCNRGHEITFRNQKIEEYKKWKKEATYISSPSAVLCPTGAGGVLYPPNCFYHDYLNKDIINKYAIMADDIWLKVMELLQGTKAVYTDNFPQWLFTIRGSQNVTLAKTNVDKNNNDYVIECLAQIYNINLYALCNNKFDA